MDEVREKLDSVYKLLKKQVCLVEEAEAVDIDVEPKFYTKYLIVIGVDLGKINDVGNDIFRTQRC